MKVIATFTAFMTLGAATPVLAQYDRGPPQGAILPPYEMMTIVRSMGFDPISRPVLRGPVYVIRALDEDDLPVRVAIDARSGNVVRVTEGGPGMNFSGSWQGGRFGAYGLPPESVPPGAVYVPPREAAPPGLAPPKPRVATRTPMPRAAPPQSKAAATPPTPSPGAAAMADPKATPGKSVPAPVANKPSSAVAAQAPTNADHTAITGTITSNKPAEHADRPAVGSETKPAELVPVAPLE